MPAAGPLDNQLAAEARIEARLQAEFEGLARVLVVAASDDLFDAVQLAPSIAIMHSGERPGPYRHGRQFIEQAWTVYAVARRVNDKTGARARAEAGRLMVRVNHALLGWAPTQEHHGEMRRGASARAWMTSAAYFYPSTWTTEIIARGNDDG